MAKKKTILVTPTARAYMNMVEDSIKRIEASSEKLTTEKKNYIECLRENVKRAPEWFLKNELSSKLAKLYDSPDIKDKLKKKK